MEVFDIDIDQQVVQNHFKEDKMVDIVEGNQVVRHDE